MAQIMNSLLQNVWIEESRENWQTNYGQRFVTLQETVNKTIPKKKKCNKAKWLSEEASLIPEKRREVKDKGEKERQAHLNLEFQRTAKRHKKAYLSEQYKEIEKNNRMEKD